MDIKTQLIREILLPSAGLRQQPRTGDVIEHRDGAGLGPSRAATFYF
jgi:hypothetical protein